MNIVLRRGIVGLVAIGDPKQLPPVILKQELRTRQYAISLFARLLSACTPHTLLNVQYRMHPEISSWPSRQFYDSKVVNGLNVLAASRKPQWQEEGQRLLSPYSYISIPGVEERNEETRSYKNLTEADIVVAFIKQLAVTLTTTNHVGTVEVGCISGYTEQAQLIQRKLGSMQQASFWETESRIVRVKIRVSNDCAIAIDIASVDAFQGQERDIIVFCTTRANPQKSIGFLSEFHLV
jgi:senataxin